MPTFKSLVVIAKKESLLANEFFIFDEDAHWPNHFPFLCFQFPFHFSCKGRLLHPFFAISRASEALIASDCSDSFSYRLTDTSGSKRRRGPEHWVPVHPFRIRWFSIRVIPSSTVCSAGRFLLLTRCTAHPETIVILTG